MSDDVATRVTRLLNRMDTLMDFPAKGERRTPDFTEHLRADLTTYFKEVLEGG